VSQGASESANGAPLQVGVIGAGSWGTALAGVAARAGHQVTLWARSPGLAAQINETAANEAYLPGLPLPAGITATADPAALAGAGVVLIAIPAQVVRETLANFAGHLAPGTAAVVCAKGIERGSHRLMSEVLAEALPETEFYVLSGPSFAADVARDLPTAVTLAGPTIEAATRLAEALSLASFRIYASDDTVGVQLGGAVKNVLAIACGISDGRGLGESARAALTTRAFAELARFGRAMGARPETLTGLSGLGDLILTCASRQSRNFAYGFALGQGASAPPGTVEGVPTAGVVDDMAQALGVDMPISAAVRRIVQGRSEIDEELGRLLARPLKAEID
jgi:glycerol-3-phosphate dehydrogenase (NAD(P)+)